MARVDAAFRVSNHVTDHQAKQMTVQRQILADNRFALLEQTLTDAIGEAMYSHHSIDPDSHLRLYQAVCQALKDGAVCHAIKAAGKPIPFVLS
jgi:hypothetical protein